MLVDTKEPHYARASNQALLMAAIGTTNAQVQPKHCSEPRRNSVNSDQSMALTPVTIPAPPTYPLETHVRQRSRFQGCVTAVLSESKSTQMSWDDGRFLRKAGGCHNTQLEVRRDVAIVDDVAAPNIIIELVVLLEGSLTIAEPRIKEQWDAGGEENMASRSGAAENFRTNGTDWRRSFEHHLLSTEVLVEASRDTSMGGCVGKDRSEEMQSTPGKEARGSNKTGENGREAEKQEGARSIDRTVTVHYVQCSSIQ
jgi:hypothetical protein